jgi:hypothetical protein
LDTLAIRFWKERTPLQWRSTIRFAFKRTGPLIMQLAAKAIEIRDEDPAIASGLLISKLGNHIPRC